MLHLQNALAVRIIVEISCRFEEGSELHLINTEKVRGMNDKGEFNSRDIADTLDLMENGQTMSLYREDAFWQDLEKLVKHDRIKFTLPSMVHKIVHIDHD